MAASNKKTLKNTSEFQNEFSDYDKTRQILHHMYLYGSYSVSDMVESNIVEGSDRAMKYHFQRIRNYISQMNPANEVTASPLEKHKLPDRKKDKMSYRFANDQFAYPNNYLAGTYRQCPVLISDLFFYIYLFTVLTFEKDFNPYSKYEFDCKSQAHALICRAIDDIEVFLDEDYSVYEFTAADLYDLFSSLYETNCAVVNELEGTSLPYSEIPLSYDQCLAKLEELVDLGILTITGERELEPVIDTKDRVHKVKNAKVYALTNPILDSLDYRMDESQFYDEVNNLLEYIKYSYNYSTLCAPGYFLSEKIDKLLNSVSQHKKQRSIYSEFHQINDCFIFEKPNYQNILDDEVCMLLLSSIHNKRAIQFKYQTKNYSSASTKTVIPLKIYTDTDYGRRYVSVLDLNIVYKSTKKKKAKETDQTEDSKKKAKPEPRIFDHAVVMGYKSYRLDRIISVKDLPSDYANRINGDFINNIIIEHSTPDKSGMEKTIDTVLHFSFTDDIRGHHMKSKLLTSNYGGTLTKIDESHYDYSISTTDYAKLIPWINSFGRFVTVDKKSNTPLFEQIKKHTLEALSFYETI